MIDSDRLDELETFRLEDDTPDDARISLPWRDLRDLVALIPVVRQAMALAAVAKVFNQTQHPLISAVDELRAKGDG